MNIPTHPLLAVFMLEPPPHVVRQAALELVEQHPDDAVDRRFRGPGKRSKRSDDEFRGPEHFVTLFSHAATPFTPDANASERYRDAETPRSWRDHSSVRRSPSSRPTSGW